MTHTVFCFSLAETKVLNELEKRCGRVDRLGNKDNLLLYAFPDHTIEYQDGRVPPQIFLTAPSEDKTQLDVDEALQQSWGWREAKDVVSTCRSPLLLTELMARRLPHKTRLGLFQNALEAVLTIAPCQAIHWIPSQQIINPSTYLEARRSKDFHPLQFALNVRFYNITNGQHGEMLMDTAGLATLGLPDLQCHFRDLDPNEVARVLYNTAHYLYDKGDIIEDGHTVQGIKPNDRWKAQHEAALMKPEREVLDLNPRQPYAAGNRE